MELLIPLFVVAFVAYFIFSVFTKKGKGRFFGGKILRTLDQEVKQKNGISNCTIRVHVIGKKETKENTVGIELSQHAFLAWSMTPISLTKTEAGELISMLQEAVKG